MPRNAALPRTLERLPTCFLWPSGLGAWSRLLSLLLQVTFLAALICMWLPLLKGIL